MTTAGTRRVAIRAGDEWDRAGEALKSASPEVDRSALVRMALRWAARDPVGAIAVMYAGSIGAPIVHPDRRQTKAELDEWYAAWRAAEFDPPRVYGLPGMHNGPPSSVAPDRARRSKPAASPPAGTTTDGADHG